MKVVPRKFAFVLFRMKAFFIIGEKYGYSKQPNPQRSRGPLAQAGWQASSARIGRLIAGIPHPTKTNQKMEYEK